MGFGGGNQAMTYAGANWNPLNAGRTQYLPANQESATYLVATSSCASVFELATDRPALALGGYQGWDRTLTPAQLAAMVSSGELCFFYIGGSTSGGGFGGRNGTNGVNSAGSTAGTSDLTAWVRSNCRTVSSATYIVTGTTTDTTNGAAAGGNAFGGG